MAVMQEESKIKIALHWLVQALEPEIVVAVGFLVMLTERFSQRAMLFGLVLLIIPLLLRLFVVGKLTTPTLVNVPLFMLLLLLAGTYWTTRSWGYTWPELVRMTWGIAVCLAVINWINPWPASKDETIDGQRDLSPRLTAATFIFCAMGVIATTIGLLGMEATAKLERIDMWLAMLPKLYISERFNSNNVAGIIVLFLPLTLALTLGPLPLRQRSVAIWLMVKTLAALLTLYLGTALLLTQTRGAWLAAGCALFMILVMLGRRGWLPLALITLIAASALFAIGPTDLLDKLTVHDIGEGRASELVQDRNLAARFILWQRAIHGIADAPLAGVGLGAFNAISMLPYPEVAGFTPDPDITHVHNIILQMGIDFGVPGIVVFVTLLIMIGRLLVLLVRQSERPSLLRTWTLGLMGSFVAYLVHNMLNATTLGSLPAVAVWFLFGLCIGAGEWALRQQRLDDIENQVTSTMSEEDGLEHGLTEWERRAWAATTGSSNR